MFTGMSHWYIMATILVGFTQIGQSSSDTNFQKNCTKQELYVWKQGHWDCTTLKHFYIARGEAGGCTVLLKGGTISMPTGRHVDNPS
jgi:hypothetical protein